MDMTWVCIYFIIYFIYGLFNDAVRIIGNTRSNGRKTSEQSIIKEVEVMDVD
jgi:hypothetical protein